LKIEKNIFEKAVTHNLEENQRCYNKVTMCGFL